MALPFSFSPNRMLKPNLRFSKRVDTDYNLNQARKSFFFDIDEWWNPKYWIKKPIIYLKEIRIDGTVCASVNPAEKIKWKDEKFIIN